MLTRIKAKPDKTVLHTYQTEWEKDYTIINFERRGTGETYFLNERDPKKLMNQLTPEQYISDIKEVVSYARERFHKDKVIKLADSFGTLIASRFVLENKDMVEAYVGSVQIVNIEQDFKSCADDMIEKATAKNDKKAVEEISHIKWGFETSKDWLNAYQTLSKYVGKYISKTAEERMLSNILAGMQSPYFPLRHITYYLTVINYKRIIMNT